jgi:acetolactate synthase I/II/III large subunit
MARMTGGQALVQQLRLEGVEMVFGLPGVQLDWAFDALYEERESIRVVHTRHEQATAYMADGFARSTGGIGTCLVVPGPGLLNAGAALSTAYACSSPVLCLTGQIDSNLIGLGRGALHEIKDQMQMIASITKWQGRAMKPEEVPGVVHRAFGELMSGRPRPVEIEIPPDVLAAQGEVRLMEAEMFERPAGDPDLIDRAARHLGEASNPLILAGGGVIRSGAWEELQHLAEMLEAPVIMTQNGRGSLSDHHHLAFAEPAMRTLLAPADAVLAVGTRFLGGATPWWPKEKPVIKLDIDSEELDRNHEPEVGIEADAKRGLAALADRVERYNRSRPSRKDELQVLKQKLVEQGNAVRPQADLGMAIRETLPDNAILFSESTQVGYWSTSYYPVYEPRTFFTSGYQGTLGYGFATAIGAQIGNPDKRVVSINGDGGFLYAASELSTLVQQKAPLIAIVFNNNSYCNVSRNQSERFGGRHIAVDLVNPDFMKLADAYGLRGRRADGPDELRRELKAALDEDVPCLIEVPVGEMEWYIGRQPPRPQAN